MYNCMYIPLFIPKPRPSVPQTETVTTQSTRKRSKKMRRRRRILRRCWQRSLRRRRKKKRRRRSRKTTLWTDSRMRSEKCTMMTLTNWLLYRLVKNNTFVALQRAQRFTINNRIVFKDPGHYW